MYTSASVHREIDLLTSPKDSLTAQYTWSQIEPAAAIVCACLVTYRPLFKDWKPVLGKLLGRINRSRVSSSETELWGGLGGAERGNIKPPASEKDFSTQDVSKFRHLSNKALKEKLQVINISVQPARTIPR